MFRAQIRADVHLQMLEERHAAEVFSLVDQDRVHLRKWLPWVDATQALDDTQTFIRASLEQFASQKGFTCGIWRERTLCGVIGTAKLDMLNRKGEIGYWLGVHFQGQGIMTAACRTVVTHMFADMDLNRVEIQCAVGNDRSCAVAQRLGFTDEGLAREAQLLHGGFRDLRRFAMLKRDWTP